jgi:hypothetical protein
MKKKSVVNMPLAYLVFEENFDWNTESSSTRQSIDLQARYIISVSKTSLFKPSLIFTIRADIAASK